MDLDEDYVIPLLLCYEEVKNYNYEELKDYIGDLDIPTDYRVINTAFFVLYW